MCLSRIPAALSLFLFLSACAGTDAPSTDAARACAGLVGRDVDVSVTAAAAIRPAPAWEPAMESNYQPLAVTMPLCRVEAMIEGNIGLEVWLPAQDRWNGRLLAAGVGGPAGVFNYTDMSRRVNEGFATFSTDSGHKASNTRWMADDKALADYTHRATHLATVASKRIAERYYGRQPDHSYFLGCSGGGRQALKEMQNYPQDFDGIVSGAPGPNMPLQSVRMMWFSLAQQQNPEARLDDGDWDLYEHAVTATCDADDGVEDGVIENPLACRFDSSVLACTEARQEACLGSAQLEMLESIVAPMVDEHGEPMDWGLVPGVRTRPGPPSPLLRALWADGVYDDPDWDENSFRRTRDLELVYEHMPEMRADRTAISPFIQRGGKAIIYQGWADPSTVAGPTIAWYRALAGANGGYRALSESVRLFMVPGMHHCRGGPGADQFGGSGHAAWPGDADRDILWAVIRWVEEGIAPSRLVASKLQEGAERFTHALCPFPAVATIISGMSGGAADHYACRVDPLLAGGREGD